MHSVKTSFWIYYDCDQNGQKQQELEKECPPKDFFKAKISLV